MAAERKLTRLNVVLIEEARIGIQRKMGGNRRPWNSKTRKDPRSQQAENDVLIEPAKREISE
jgi:hypothetical protein